jgi:hypothetical protein
MAEALLISNLVNKTLEDFQIDLSGPNMDDPLVKTKFLNYLDNLMEKGVITSEVANGCYEKVLASKAPEEKKVIHSGDLRDFRLETLSTLDIENPKQERIDIKDLKEILQESLNESLVLLSIEMTIDELEKNRLKSKKEIEGLYLNGSIETETLLEFYDKIDDKINTVIELVKENIIKDSQKALKFNDIESGFFVTENESKEIEDFLQSKATKVETKEKFDEIVDKLLLSERQGIIKPIRYQELRILLNKKFDDYKAKLRMSKFVNYTDTLTSDLDDI